MNGVTQGIGRGLLVLAVGTALAGCQSSGRRVAYDDPWMNGSQQAYRGQPAAPYNVPTYEAPANQPVAQPQISTEPMAGTAGNEVASLGATMETNDAATMRLRERLERVERAMLRLDRRMQLVERNELGRMNGSDQMSGLEGGETFAMLNGPAPASGFSNVSAERPITSALQAAAPAGGGNNGFMRVADGQRQVASASGLPSLADKAPAAGRAPAEAVSIWTVRYGTEKIWPEREQLPASRDVVDSLRSGTPTTVFARGSLPQSVEFRDRVKALSRYLAKVSGQETVAISALNAPHLDKDTIEIFASH